jgi:RNA recognition motif-containing protein
MGTRIFVGNLPYSTTSADLEQLFSEFGGCESASIVTDRETGRSRGFGFVEMSDGDAARQAMEALNGRQMGGRALTVNEAHERPRGGGGGGGGGERRGGGGGRGGGRRERY